MSDLISRQAAIDAVIKRDANCGIDSAEVLRALPPAQLEQQWIPCSERLPEKEGRYLVTCTKWGAWAVDWNIWHKEPKEGWLWEQSVSAWMPLPDPYIDHDIRDLPEWHFEIEKE